MAVDSGVQTREEREVFPPLIPLPSIIRMIKTAVPTCQSHHRMFLLFLLLSLSCVLCQRTFDGFSVIRVKPDTREKLEFLKSVAYDFDNDVNYVNEVNFWKRPRSVNETVDLMVSPTMLNNVQTLLNSNYLDPQILIDDLQSRIEREKSNSSDDLIFRTKSYLDTPNAFFMDYHRLGEIHDYMKELAQEYPNRVKIQNLGQSYEGRNMLMWILTNNVQNRDSVAPKPIIWIDSGIHAREWISPATGLFLATQVRPSLVTQSGSNRLFFSHS